MGAGLMKAQGQLAGQGKDAGVAGEMDLNRHKMLEGGLFGSRCDLAEQAQTVQDRRDLERKERRGQQGRLVLAARFQQRVDTLAVGEGKQCQNQQVGINTD